MLNQPFTNLTNETNPFEALVMLKGLKVPTYNDTFTEIENYYYWLLRVDEMACNKLMGDLTQLYRLNWNRVLGESRSRQNSFTQTEAFKMWDEDRIRKIMAI